MIGIYLFMYVIDYNNTSYLLIIGFIIDINLAEVVCGFIFDFGNTHNILCHVKKSKLEVHLLSY